MASGSCRRIAVYRFLNVIKTMLRSKRAPFLRSIIESISSLFLSTLFTHMLESWRWLSILSFCSYVCSNHTGSSMAFLSGRLIAGPARFKRTQRRKTQPGLWQPVQKDIPYRFKLPIMTAKHGSHDFLAVSQNFLVQLYWYPIGRYQ